VLMQPGVRINSFGQADRVNVDVHAGGAGDMCKYLLAGTLSDGMSLQQRHRRVSAKVERNIEASSGPAGAHILYLTHSWDRSSALPHLRDDGGVYRIHQAMQYVAADIQQNVEDGNGDQQASNRVGLMQAKEGEQQADSGGKRSEAIGARVLAICNKRCAVDPSAHANLILRHSLVSHESDERGGDAPADVSGHRVGHQATVGGEGGRAGAQRDNEGDKRSSQVFGARVAVGEPIVGRSAREQEGHEDGDSGEDVAKVVQGIREQTSALAQCEEEELNGGDEKHGDRRDGDRAQSLCCAGGEIGAVLMTMPMHAPLSRYGGTFGVRNSLK